MADSGQQAKRYALRGKVSKLCKSYKNPWTLRRAISTGSEGLVKGYAPKDTLRQTVPAYRFLRLLNSDPVLRNLDVVFEYVIPGTSRRVDAIVFGKLTKTTKDRETGEEREEHNDYALIVEFKSWLEERWNGGFENVYESWHLDNDGRMKAYLRKPEDEDGEGGDGTYDVSEDGEGTHEKGQDGQGTYDHVTHPLFQALSYRNFLNNFHSVASDSRWWLEGVCYLPGINDIEFLYSGDAADPAFRKDSAQYIMTDDVPGDDGSGDSEPTNADLVEWLKRPHGSRSGITPSDTACDAFLAGIYENSEKAAGVIQSICLAAAGHEDNPRKPYFNVQRRALSHVLSKVRDGSADRKWAFVANVQDLLDAKERSGAPMFLNHADIAISMQNAFLQDGLPQTSLQTDSDALEELWSALSEMELPKDAKRVSCSFQKVPLKLVSGFNAFNAYKWEPAVFSPIGIVDLCGSRRQTWDGDSLEKLMENSTEAQFIVLLVDDETPVAKHLEGRIFAGYKLIHITR